MKLTHIFEQFDQHLPIKYIMSSSTVFKAQFIVNDNDAVTVTIEADGDPAVWDISFERGNPKFNGKMNITGEGNPQQVFATVMEVIKQFVTKYNHPQCLSFSSHKSEDSRVSLYGKMASRYANALGYRWVQDPLADPVVPDWFKQTIPGLTKYQVLYVLVKN